MPEHAEMPTPEEEAEFFRRMCWEEVMEVVQVKTIPKGQTRDVTLNKPEIDALVQVLRRHPLDEFERNLLREILGKAGVKVD